jgi:hypothetical protein
MANVVVRPDLLFANPIRGLLGSHLLFGALVLLGLLVWLRSSHENGPKGELAMDAPLLPAAHDSSSMSGVAVDQAPSSAMR